MPPQKVTALSSENAFILLHVKINKDYVFCIELQYGVPIIVKHSQYHGWQQQMLPGKAIVLTSLRPTTLAKEYKPPQRVYVPWTGSCLIPKDSNIEELSLQDWLANYGVAPPQATMVPPNFKADFKLASFQGVVTDNSTRAYGVIVLDSTTRRKEKQLFCCVRSRICILQKKPSETKREEQQGSLQSLLRDDSFTMSDTLALIHLHQNIVTTLSVRSQFNVKNVMRHLVYKVWNQGVERRRRNFLLEFCQPEAFCPFANDQDYNIPILTQLGDLKQMDLDNASVSDIDLETQRTDCENLWTYSTRKFVEKSTKPFLGWLALNPVTGRLQLQSDKDKMNVVVLSSDSETPELTHQCSSSCHCNGLHPGQRMSCPFIHPCCLGHLLLVTKYLVVKEAFSNSSNHQSITTDHIHYLIISTCDCILVDKKHLSPPACSAQKHASEDSTHSFAGHEKRLRSESRRKMAEKYECNNSYLVYITSKESLLAKTNLTSESRLQFFAEATLMTSVSSGKGSFITLGDFSASQPLVLAFRNRSCMWHDAIQPKGLYCFSMKYSGDKHALLWPQMDKKLQALQNGAAMTEVKVSDEAEIDRIFNSFTEPGMLVSFMGIIMWRKHPQLSMHMSTAGTTNNCLHMVHPDTLQGCLKGRCLCVGVKDSMQGPSSARVYFNNTAVIYPLGLLPGMMVEFLRVDKRVSRSGNTYFQFLSVSSLRILSGPKQTANLILIEDGSCQALVSIKYGGVDVAQRLLKLSQQEWFCLEKVFDRPGGTAAEVFVSQLCNSVDVRRPCIMLLQKSMSSYKKAAGIDDLSQNDLVTRKINTGELTVETLCLPYLQLECLDIQEV
ncbi:hypothetical protein C0Q70_20354 [Pomacea canaliculata]|uniref:Uncharacterized protein n=1 Tax=Pomacea canaliculata TaxID=400727 RepID=A0A2T7NFC2_POMCA|nr:hypothetical protein C0Q70_20354 [Pomacea canaliculata]